MLTFTHWVALHVTQYERNINKHYFQYVSQYWQKLNSVSYQILLSKGKSMNYPQVTRW